MKQANILKPTSLISYLYLLGWIFQIGFAGKFVFQALPYFSLDQEVFGRYWDFKWSPKNS